MKKKQENTIQDTNFIDLLPDDLLKEIFKYLFEKKNLVAASQVQKKWHKLIVEQYSKSVYGKMLRFARFASSPITEIIDELNELQKKLHYTLMSYTRNHPLIWPHVLFVIVLAYQFITLLAVNLYDQQWSFEHRFSGSNLRYAQKFLRKTGLPEWYIYSATEVSKFFASPQKGVPSLLIILLFYVLYVKYRNYQYQNQPLNADINTKVTSLLRGDQIILQLLYDVTNNFNQYPPLQNNPTMTLSQLETALLKDKKALEELNQQFHKSIEILFFNPRQQITLDDFCSDNLKFRRYLQKKLLFWNDVNQNIPDNKIEIDKSNKIL